MNYFFKVKAKCAHVGRNKYYEATFFVRADDGGDAASKIRNAPRVKHDKKDAIISVEAITYKEYIEGCKSMCEEPFFHCYNSQDQLLQMERISEFIFQETKNLHEPIEYDRDDDEVKYVKQKRIRNRYKYLKMNFSN